MILQGYEVEREKIPEYLSSEYTPYIELFLNYRQFGFPYNGNWGEQPAHVFDVIKTLLIEDSKWQTIR